MNPWGWEALRAHRTLRLLADRLAETGLDVLRFDYSGTGDSMGDHDDVTLARWIDDAGEALDELVSLSGARRVSVVGLRIGALVAGELLKERRRYIDRVVLWNAPGSGSEAVAWARGGPAPETRAFPVPHAFEREASTMTLDPLERFKGHALVVDRGPDTDFEGARSLTTIGTLDDLPPCWTENRTFGAGAVPIRLLEELVEWLAA